MKKSTAELLEELKSCTEFKSFYKENGDELLPTAELSHYLNELVKKHGIKKSEAIKRSELSEVYAYQIFSGIRVPERKKLLSLAVGMELELDEIQNLLRCSGYAPLYAKNTFDCIVIYGICKKLSVADINFILFDYELETLG